MSDLSDLNAVSVKKFSKHLLECPSHSCRVPKELIELQCYLKELSALASRYRTTSGEIRKNSARNEPRVMAFSALEDTAPEPASVEVIEPQPPETIAVISSPVNQEVRDDQSDTESMYSVVEGEEQGDTQDSDDSEIGVYFVEDVQPVRVIDVIQRELCTLADLSPSVCDIVQKISNEFNHFKVCCSCLKKVSPLLPDILKELQELIKFIRKNRNETYKWPNDSDYLRKFCFKKEDSKKKTVQEETVGYVTIQTKLPETLRKEKEVVRSRAGVHGRLEVVGHCSVKLTNLSRFSAVESPTIEWRKRDWNDTVFLIEISSVQVVRIVYPEPIVQAVVQTQIQEAVTHIGGSELLSEDSKDENFTAARVRNHLLSTRLSLGEACEELDLVDSSSRMEYERELGVAIKHLKSLMLEVHKNQIELSKVLLEKEVLSPTMVQLTDPQMLYEERQGILRAKNSMSKSGPTSDDLKLEEFQEWLNSMEKKCNTKNRIIIALLNGLRSNIPKEHWEELINCMLQESDSIQKVALDKMNEFLRRSSYVMGDSSKVLYRCQELKKNEPVVKAFDSKTISEVLSERDIKSRSYGYGSRLEKEVARISFSEIISRKPKPFETVEKGRTSIGYGQPSKREPHNAPELTTRTKNLLKDLHNGINYPTTGKNEILFDEEGMKDGKPSIEGDEITRREANASQSRTINLTIKIGEKNLKDKQSKSATSNLAPQFAFHCEQNRTIQNLRSRLQTIDENIKGLKLTINRMDIVTDKLVDDAFESSNNFESVSDRLKNFLALSQS